MIEDFVNNNVVDPENMPLNHIQEILRNNGSSCENFQLPNPIPVNIYVTEYNVDEEKRRGSGKTYLFNTFLSVIRGRNEMVIPCASTGIAATLLKGRRTYHSLFKLSIPIDDGAKSNIRGNSQATRELISAKLIIWDEVSMTVGHALTAVDKLFKDLMKNERPFGGKVILLLITAGDFRQNLPVVPYAQKAAIIESTVKYNPIWRNVTQVKLQQNMRTGEEKEFANWLMQLGDESP
ncbi:ATP-dependent DNA helicase pif1-like [Anoplolepis gracilipes]|uniref:ATP-dependent DNA helicase pif1-like n=1 Tax=Anoplolepis gracilipes TaxID=354296 RepID=UPI003B9EE5AA